MRERRDRLGLVRCSGRTRRPSLQAPQAHGEVDTPPWLAGCPQEVLPNLVGAGQVTGKQGQLVLMDPARVGCGAPTRPGDDQTGLLDKWAGAEV